MLPAASHHPIAHRQITRLLLLLLSRRIQPPPIAFFSVCLSLLRPPSPSFFSVSVNSRPSSPVLPIFSAFFPARTCAPAQTLRRDGQTLLPDLLLCPDGQTLLPRRLDPLRYAATLPKSASQPSLPRSALVGLPIKLNMEDDNSVNCGADLDINDNVNVVEAEDEHHEVGQGGEVSVSEKVVKDETKETDVVAPKQKSEYK
ncbi:hypothetical protein ACLOJK_004942, partial [Asimina triloba]